MMSKIKTGGLLSKIISLHVLKKAVVKHKEAEAFENNRLQSFAKDFGIEIVDGVGKRIRPKKKFKSLDEWQDVETIIRNLHNHLI